jgi:Snf7 protein
VNFFLVDEMEEDNQSRSPLLTSEPRHLRRGFFAWLLSVFTAKEKKAREPPSNAETVRLLMAVITDLGMAMDYAEAQAAKKKDLAIHVRAKGHKEQAYKAWATAKQYEKRYTTWFDMRENVELIKSELIAQQQSLAVFGAFSLANSALETIAKKLNLSTLESVLTSLHEKLENGAEMSQILASPSEFDSSYDEDALANEMAQFVVGAEQTPVTEAKVASPSPTKTEKFFSKERGLLTTET